MHVYAVHRQIDKKQLYAVEINGNYLWFSSSTLIGFKSTNGDPVFCENIWSQTAACHLARLGSRHDERLPRHAFLDAATKFLLRFNVEEEKSQ